MDRFSFIRHFAAGRILDIGSGDRPIFADRGDVIEVDNLSYIFQPKAGYKPDGTKVIEDIGAWRENEVEKIKRVYKGRDFIIADGRHLPFPDESFDSVILGEVLEHVEEPKELLKEAKRVLRPNGLIIGTCPNEYAWDRSLCPFEHSGHLHYFKEGDLRRLFREANLRLRLFYNTPPEWNFGFVFYYFILQKVQKVEEAMS